MLFLSVLTENCSWKNKHLMTGPEGNSEFCFPETLNVPRGESEGNIEVEGKQNSLFPAVPVIKCFVIPPNSKNRKKNKQTNQKCKEIVCLTPAGSQIFRGERPYHVRVEGSSCCFLREFVSFVRPRELASFDPRHVSRSPSIVKGI